MPEQVLCKMATNEVAEYPQKKEVLFPPKRGNKIKAKIFEDLKKSVIKVASKAKGGLGRKRGDGGSSDSSTAPTSCYTSEGNIEA
ncbi:hypothetical protein FRX31_006255 [Thalictrum thalictroides]|uniref:Uncharacterized protein n=1 Tax=Thalictrum thalictroides TaxID=46969 RepID=A0A7J6X313_THATH|nr:hypothetical protein FRX31_006255 [Thalictrum thalictroides]